MALLELEELKDYLGITSTTQDVILDIIRLGVVAAVENQTGREFESQARTEYYDGPGERLLILNHRPVTAVTSVHVDSTGYAGQGTTPFESSSEWTQGDYFFIRPPVEASERNPGILEAINGVWTKGRGNIKVVYTAGYSTLPEDLKLAVCQVCAAVRKRRTTGGSPLQSETIGRYAYQLMNSDEAKKTDLSNAMGIIESYTPIVIGF